MAERRTPAFRLAVVVGTRPELIRLSRVLDECRRRFELTLIHTGQNYDYSLNGVFFDELGLPRPDYFLEAAGDTPMQTIARVLERVDPIFERVSPDAVLILGDTNSCLAAVAAKRRHIPVFHMEAGNRCFDMRVPEELNRRIVDHVSDVNLTYSDHARTYLLREGLPPDRVIKTGSPMYEVLHHYLPNIEQSTILARLGLQERGYVVVSCHREENVDSPRYLEAFAAVLERVARHYDRPLIVSTHPRTRKRLAAMNVTLSTGIRLFEPFGFFDFVKLEKSAFVTLSDSGTITEEASILGFPAVNIRESHERPEGADEANVPMAGLHADRILQCIDVVTAEERDPALHFSVPSDYVAPNVSRKVVRLILGYTDYVERTVWQRSGPSFAPSARFP